MTKFKGKNIVLQINGNVVATPSRSEPVILKQATSGLKQVKDASKTNKILIAHGVGALNLGLALKRLSVAISANSWDFSNYNCISESKYKHSKPNNEHGWYRKFDKKSKNSNLKK